MIRRALLASALLAASTAQAAVTAPSLVPGQAQPVAAPYDTAADAHAEVAAGFAKAKAEHKTLLVDFGGNWCPDCRKLAGVFDAPALAPWLARHFVLVKVDVGRFDKNMDIATAHGVKLTGVPAVLAFAPDGRLLDGDDVIALDTARHVSDQAVADKLASWAPS